MNRITNLVAISAVCAVLTASPLVAQYHDDHDDHRNDQRYDQRYDRRDDHRDADRHDAYVRHEEWRRGYHMRHEDWDRGRRIDDWRMHHLRRPPRGYEWREVDGNYVMAALATGIIASVVAANAAH